MEVSYISRKHGFLKKAFKSKSQLIPKFNFDELYRLDEAMRKKAIFVLEKLPEIAKQLPQLPAEEIPVQPENEHKITGSLVEGAAICRILAHPEHEIVVESDIMMMIGEITESESQKILQPLEDWPGFYRLIMNNTLKKCISDPKSMRNQNGKYFDSSIIKKYFFDLCRLTAMENVDIIGPSVHIEDNKRSTLLTTLLMEDYKDDFYTQQHDNVFSFHLLFWPKMFLPWFDKKREWPPKDILEEIKSKGCHLVAKAHPGSESSIEWRISFSQPEMILSRIRTPFQSKCYLVAKCIYYVYIKGHNEPTEEEMPSYILKTLMFELIEETPEATWIRWEQDQNVFEVATILFQKLQDCLDNRYLCSYFCRDINLLHGLTVRFMRSMRDLARQISKCPWDYIPLNLDYIMEKIKKHLEKFPLEKLECALHNLAGVLGIAVSEEECTLTDLLGYINGEKFDVAASLPTSLHEIFTSPLSDISILDKFGALSVNDFLNMSRIFLSDELEDDEEFASFKEYAQNHYSLDFQEFCTNVQRLTQKVKADLQDIDFDALNFKYIEVEDHDLD